MNKVYFERLNSKLQKFLLEKQSKETGFDIDKYLNPSLEHLHDPFDLLGMREAVNRLEKALKNQEQIVIYGDYDCDGISASTILHLYISSKGGNSHVYIPNRFDDGYGITQSTIDEIQTRYNPQLIITVDLGITAIEETKEIKNRGIDIIITDHHEMAETLPDTIVIDPKIPGQKYPFSGLCGAGVALKLVQAHGGINEAYKYFDLASIATIGDIVPLTDENRVIAKLGLDIINSGKSRESIKFLLKNLQLSHINSTDVAFKLVPRINASGRMDKGIKVFDFFIAEDERDLRDLYILIEADNAERLAQIQKGNAEIEQAIKSLDMSKTPILLIVGDFHQGVLGILASRISHDYNRPTICFTKTDYGTYKGSGRSIGDIDLHAITLSLSHLCVRCGGHKMAIGLEVEEGNFDEFKNQITQQMNKKTNEREFLLDFDYSIEIDEKDINKKFIDDLTSLEPFGANNEKPVFMLRVGELKVQQMPGKSYKHFKFITPSGKQIVAFSSASHVSVLTNKAEKQLIVDLENNEFKGKFYPQALLKNIKVESFEFNETRQENMISSLYLLYQSHKEQENNKPSVMTFNKKNYLEVIKENTTSAFTHAVIIDNAFDYEFINNIKDLGYEISNTPLLNKQNVIIVRPEGICEPDSLVGYKTVFYLRRCFKEEHNILAKNRKLFVPEYITKLSAKLMPEREVLGSCFVAIKSNLDMKSNNIFEWAEKLSGKQRNISKAELVFALLIFSQLNIFSIDTTSGFDVSMGERFNQKQELEASKIYREVKYSIEKNK